MSADEPIPVDPAAEAEEAATPEAIAEEIEAEVDHTFDDDYEMAPRDPELYGRSMANAVIAARCADEMRGKDIVVLDMTRIASIVDFFVIATGKALSLTDSMNECNANAAPFCPLVQISRHQ